MTGVQTCALPISLKVDDNTLASGVREYVVWYTAWGEEVAVLDNTAADIQAAIDAAEPGAVIDLTAVPSFDFGDDGITIAKDNITLKGDNTRIIGNGVGNGLFYITGSNVTIKGFDFVDVNPSNIFVYGGSVNGWGVNMRGVTGGLISDCTLPISVVRLWFKVPLMLLLKITCSLVVILL